MAARVGNIRLQDRVLTIAILLPTGGLFSPWRPQCISSNAIYVLGPDLQYLLAAVALQNQKRNITHLSYNQNRALKVYPKPRKESKGMLAASIYDTGLSSILTFLYPDVYL